MTSMGEEPVSEQEFQDFAKVVISLLKQFVGLVYSLFPSNILFEHPVASAFSNISGSSTGR